ncbi:ribosome biogenesis GTPase Der [Spiroplasma endosymbiont of Aspidapion aeneum]|uniref:ribosome biogenesis GTPase Der n=1 Tax=Spiroplasma endosymbiont of Aspidapion aeneum TaxID=3066276 RepID=UPI00313C8FCB
MAQKKVFTIVGRPNVGKSTFFNRIIKERKSIVEDTPGVTRDRIYGQGEWITIPFILIDTGGIVFNDDLPFSRQIKLQAQIAIEEADVILFLINYKEGITNEDEEVAKLLYKANKPILLVANKYDNKDSGYEKYEFMSLGFGEPYLISSSHGIGIGDLMDGIFNKIPKEESVYDDNELKITIVGRPNVGKSSLLNSLVNEDRMIVSDIPGTTRDSVDTRIKFKGKDYILVDTAGLRKRGKIYENIEKYSYLRSLSSINKSDIVILVVDISNSIIDQDTNIGGLAFDEKKPIIIIANKWDLVEDKSSAAMNKKEKEIRSYFKYLQYAKIVFTSAIERTRIHNVFETIDLVKENMSKRIKTSILNEIFNKAQLINPAPDFNGGRLKIYFVNQVKAYMPTFVLFVNNPNYVHFSYKRFLENQIRAHFNFDGVPINIIFREKK